jgi:hypothetical protein
MHRRLILALALAVGAPMLAIAPPAPAAEVKVDNDVMDVPSVKGKGEDNDTAMRNAKAQAILKAVGKFVHTRDEKAAFEAVAETMCYDEQDRYILEAQMLDKYRQAGQVTVEMSTRVDARAIYTALVERQVVRSVEKLTQEMDYPHILAYADPAAKKDAETGWAIDRLNHLFQTEGCDVVLQEEIDRLLHEDMAIAHAKGAARERAMNAKVGSDVFVKVTARIANTRKSGDFTFAQATVTLEAIDCHSQAVTARVTGKSRELALSGNVATSRKAAVEEAVASVGDELLTRLMASWKDQIANGRRYAVAVTGGDAARVKRELEGLGATVEAAGPGRFTVVYKGSLHTLDRALRKKLPLKKVRADAGSLELRYK